MHILDINNIKFEDIKTTAVSLSTLPKLKQLNISLSSQNEAFIILENIPQLEYLNGKSTKEETNLVDIEENEMEEINFDSEFLYFNEIFKKFKEWFNLYYSQDRANCFSDEFNKLLKDEIKIINESIEYIPNYIYASNVISSKCKIYYFFQENIFNNFYQFEKISGECLKFLKEISYKFKQNSDLSKLLIQKLYPKITEKTFHLKSQLEDALKGANLVENELKFYNEKIDKLNKLNKSLNDHMDEEKSELLLKIENLKNENNLLTNKLLKRTDDLIEEHKNNDINFENSKNKITNLNSSKKILINNSQIIICNRVLTNKMIKEIINEIYESKEIFDNKCNEMKLPKETMEQHMYYYLNNKYGLKNLVIEWATSIINGIKQYSKEDPEIALFGKILRNEIDEDTRFEIIKLKDSINYILKNSIMLRYKNKTIEYINDLLKQKEKGFLEEKEWNDIIFNLYDSDDVLKIQEIIYNQIIINLKSNSNLKIPSKKLTREEEQKFYEINKEKEIEFKFFLKIVLEFQINIRENYLRNFVTIFKIIDIDNNGIFDENQFFQFIYGLEYYGDDSENQTERLLNLIDPNNNKQATFNECISLLINEIITDEDSKGNDIHISLMDKISSDDNIVKIFREKYKNK